MASDHDGVGYCRPPKHSRFQPGQSGNPKGRPKGAKSLAAIIRAALNQRVYVVENGRRHAVTKLEAITTQLVNKATSADLSATKLLLAMFDVVEKEDGASPARQAELSQDDENLMKQLLERMQNVNKEDDNA
jgi:hypothetical protein